MRFNFSRGQKSQEIQKAAAPPNLRDFSQAIFFLTRSRKRQAPPYSPGQNSRVWRTLRLESHDMRFFVPIKIRTDEVLSQRLHRNGGARNEVSFQFPKLIGVTGLTAAEEPQAWVVSQGEEFFPDGCIYFVYVCGWGKMRRPRRLVGL